MSHNCRQPHNGLTVSLNFRRKQAGLKFRELIIAWVHRLTSYSHSYKREIERWRNICEIYSQLN